jgi:tetratricopeptide (TPR) repeat protein
VISSRVNLRWDCACGHANEAPVWRVLDGRERADALRPDTPGLVCVVCESCGAPREVLDALLLVRSGTVAPVVVVLSWEQLKDPGPVLSELPVPVGREVSAQPVLAPRILLPLLLVRNVDADAFNSAVATEEVRSSHGDQLADLYAQFLVLATDQYDQSEPVRLLSGLLTVSGEELLEWLDAHPQATSPRVIARLDLMIAQATAARDQAAVGWLGLKREMLGAIAGGAPAGDVVKGYVAARTQYFDQNVIPEVDRLWAVARSANTEEAIRALRGLLASVPPPDRRGAELLLAKRLLSPQGDADAAAEAIALLERVRDSSPTHDSIWASATGHLAVAIGNRPGADLDNSWRRSVALLRESLTVADAERRTIAMNETNLGLALLNRPGGSTAGDVNEAVERLERSLAGRSPETSVEDWATSKINLGLAHNRRNGPGDLHRAIGHFRDVTKQLCNTKLTRPLVYAELDLANALLAADPPRAEEALDIAAAATRRTETLEDPFLRGWALRTLGDAYAAIGGAESAAAVSAWQRGVDVLNPRVHSAYLLDSADRLAAAYYAAEAWDPLADLYGRMLEAYDALYIAQATTDTRRQVLTRRPRLARWAAYALARTGRIEAAIEALEQARTRDLGVRIRRDTADLTRLGRFDPHLETAYRDALAAYRAAVGSQAKVPSVSEATGDEAAVTAVQELQRVIGEIHAIPGLKEFLAAPSAVQSLRLTAARQAVYILSAPAGTFLLRVLTEVPDGTARYDAVHVNVTSRDMAGMLLVDLDNRQPGFLLAQSSDSDAHAFEKALNRLYPCLAPLVYALGNLVGEVAPELSVLVPTGLAGLVPLQSLPMDDHKTTLDDIAEVHLAPSIAVYAASRRRAERTIAPVLVSIVDTDPDAPLPGSRGEVRAIAALPGWASVTVAVGAEATLDWLKLHAPNASHLHFACHGRHDPSDPEGGYLALGMGEQLSFPDLVQGAPLQARVAVASACQSAHFDTGALLDEHVGLATGLLQAGVACAVVSLWPVSDESTALLMTRFYELLSPGGASEKHPLSPPAALRRARLWLRDLTDASRSAYLASQPALAAALRNRGLPSSVSTGSRGPYDAIEHWGAFVAYGY